jgi:large subunit ribosomal protein L28
VAVCQVCHKHTVFGHNIRHKSSGRWERKAHRTQRTFAPNVHKQRVLIDGRPQRIAICTRCLRTTLKLPKA